ncbi:MAG: phage tail protein I [Pseudohongiellaceae bacterium]
MSDLLPANSTALELAISEVSHRDVPLRTRDVWNPTSCPAAVLPWLAWAWSVDDWDPQWSESQKRGAVAAAFAVHRSKGTPAALQSALDGIGYTETGLLEWFQESPPAAPYTFAILVTVEQQGIPDLETHRMIEKISNSTKNARSRMTGIGIHGRTTGAAYYGAALISGETVTIMAEPA